MLKASKGNTQIINLDKMNFTNSIKMRIHPEKFLIKAESC